MAGTPRKEPGHGPTFTLAAHDSADEPTAHTASGALHTASGAPVPDRHTAAPSPRRGPAPRWLLARSALCALDGWPVTGTGGTVDVRAAQSSCGPRRSGEASCPMPAENRQEGSRSAD